METFEFRKAYRNLNPQQKQAVDSIEGPVMVIAGPGTGKTQILTLLIANILLQTQVNPDNILALTFTDSAVLAMRKRLAEIIGTLAYKVEITTFHSFGSEVIKHNPEDFPHLISATSMTEIEQIQLLEEIINQSSLELLKPFGDPLYYLKYSLSAINDLKKEGVSVTDFAEGIIAQEKDFAIIKDLYHEKGAYKGQMKGKYSETLRDINKQKELLIIYTAYQQALQTKKLYDFNDMLLEVVKALSTNKELLLRLQERYQYILVDEHQDTNTAQNKLVELLCNFYENPNLFVVGDEKQAIYRFQGASLENFLYFKKLYPKAILINLNFNYRSTQTILDAAGSVIKINIISDLMPERVALQSSSKYPEEPIRLIEFTDYYSEYYFYAKDIGEKITAGIAPKEIAVLARNNRDLIILASVLEQAGVKYSVEADQNIFADASVRKFLMLLEAVAFYGEDAYLIPALHLDFLGIKPLDLYKLMKYARASKLSVFEIVTKSEILNLVGIEKEGITTFYKLLENWQIQSKNDNLETLFVSVLNDSKLLDYILTQPSSIEIIEKLTILFEEIKLQAMRNPQFNLTDFLAYLNLLKEHDILIKCPTQTPRQDYVRLMTAHKSKGLEFEYVYIINCFNGHWGNMRRRSSGIAIPWEYFGVKLKLGIDIEQNEDERRLFYVALTRAKKGVTISYSSKSLEGKEQLPAQFIGEIEDKYKRIEDTTSFQEDFSSRKEQIFRPRVKSQESRVKDMEFFKEIFLERGLSVSGLNNYLKCPWRFFYRNMLLLPEIKDRSRMFGTAIHKALQNYINHLNQGDASNTLLIQGFIDDLAREPLAEKDFEDLLKKGQKVLQNYFDQRITRWNKGVQSEVVIKGVRLTDDVIINGVVDMIEKIDSKGHVRVFDFKTGKPRSRGEIEGKTGDSNGDYLRQLVFYKLLIDKYYQGKMEMKEGVIDFVESDVKGKIRSESFEITSEQVATLETMILQVAKEIINLDFWDRRCQEPTCEYCELRGLMI